MSLCPNSSPQPASSRACASNMPGQVRERRAVDRVREVALRVVEVPQPHRAAEALDGPDARQRRHDRLAHAPLEQEPRLRDVRRRCGPRVEPGVEQLGAEVGAVLRLPRRDRVVAEPAARRVVARRRRRGRRGTAGPRSRAARAPAAREQLVVGPASPAASSAPLTPGRRRRVHREGILVGIPPATTTAAATSRPQSGPLGRADRRLAILAGAASAFADRGFAGTSMEEIAAASGITKLIVYRHFDSKEELYRAVLAAGARAARPRSSVPSSPTGPRASPASMLAVAREHPDGVRLLWRHAAREPQFAEYSDELRARALTVSRTLLEPYVDAVRVGRGRRASATGSRRCSPGSTPATRRATSSSSPTPRAPCAPPSAPGRPRTRRTEPGAEHALRSGAGVRTVGRATHERPGASGRIRRRRGRRPLRSAPR